MNFPDLTPIGQIGPRIRHFEFDFITDYLPVVSEDSRFCDMLWEGGFIVLGTPVPLGWC
jgi:hypothetical protein